MVAVLFILGAAASPALAFNSVVTVVGARIADRVERRRLAALLREVEQDLSVVVAAPAAVDAWVADECGPGALDPFVEVSLGGRRLRVSDKQLALVYEYLGDEDDRRLRPFLTKLVVQTRAAA